MNAFCTLLTSANYLPGALVLSKSLKRHTVLPLICLISPDILCEKELLEKYFDLVRIVDLLSTPASDLENLDLLGRRDLVHSLTKIAVFQLTEYDRICFLDADTLVISNIDDIFSYVDENVEFAAAPDIGWPDYFNSGVFVCKPSNKLYDGLIKEMKCKGTFDGGDQGLLNSYFNGWAKNDAISQNSIRTARLPFIFNVTPTSFYSYLPALRSNFSNIRIIHFIGIAKPWRYSLLPNGTRFHNLSQGDVSNFVDLWWQILDENRIYENLQVLERDWRTYTPTSAGIENQSIGNPTNFFIQNQKSAGDENRGRNEYRNYNWKDEDLGVRKNKSRSPKKIAFNGYVEMDKKSEVRPPNTKAKPTKSAISPKSSKYASSKTTAASELENYGNNSKSNESEIATAQETQRVSTSNSNSMFEQPGSIYNLHPVHHNHESLVNYDVKWNEDELRGSVASTSAKRKKSKDNEHFTISADGLITYK